jgi:Bacterial PH domain
LTYRARNSVGGLLGLLFIGLVIALDAWLLNLLINSSIRAQQINFLSFLMAIVVLCSIPLLVLLIYHVLSCLTLHYRIDRNAMVVQWLGTQELIPIGDIQRIVMGQQLDGTIEQRRGIHWPGYERGEGLLPGVGYTRFLATRPLAEQVLLVVPGQAYGISPRDPERFVQAFDARRALGPNRLVEADVCRARWLTWPLWTDHTAWVLLGVALLINLGLFAYLSARFPSLDYQLPLHFTNQGLADRIGTKMELFALPIIGLVILGTNALVGLICYRWERAASYLLWGAAAAVQTLFWLAVFSIGP